MSSVRFPDYADYERKLYRNVVDAEPGEWLKGVHDETERLAMYGDKEVLDAARSSLIHALRDIYGRPKNMPRHVGRMLELYDDLNKIGHGEVRKHVMDAERLYLMADTAIRSAFHVTVERGM